MPDPGKQPPFINPILYYKDMEVPPVPAQFKYRISKELSTLYYDYEARPKYQEQRLREILAGLNDKERRYVTFWWNREYYNPEWRNTDENQGKPLRAHLTLVKE